MPFHRPHLPQGLLRPLLFAGGGLAAALICIAVLVGAQPGGSVFDPAAYAGEFGAPELPAASCDSVVFDAQDSGGDGLSVDERAEQDADIDRENGADTPLQVQDPAELLGDGARATPMPAPSPSGEAAAVNDGGGITITVNDGSDGGTQGGGTPSDAPGSTPVPSPTATAAPTADPNGPDQGELVPNDPMPTPPPVIDPVPSAAPVPSATPAPDTNLYPTQDEDAETGTRVSLLTVTPSDTPLVLAVGEAPDAATMAAAITVDAVMRAGRDQIVRGNIAYDSEQGYTIDWDASTDAIEPVPPAAPCTVSQDGPAAYTACVYYHGSARTTETLFCYTVARFEVLLTDFSENLGSGYRPRPTCLFSAVTLPADAGRTVDLSADFSRMRTVLANRMAAGRYTHIPSEPAEYTLDGTAKTLYGSFFLGWAESDDSSPASTVYSVPRPVSLALTGEGTVGCSLFADADGALCWRVALVPQLGSFAGLACGYDPADDRIYLLDITQETETLAVPDGVTDVRLDTFARTAASEAVTALTLPPSVTAFVPDTGLNLAYMGRPDTRPLPRMTEISVAADNPVFSALAGCLYDKAGQVFLYLPRGLSSVSAWSSCVTTLGTNALHGITDARGGITLPPTITTLQAGCFAGTAFARVSLSGLTRMRAQGVGGALFQNAGRLPQLTVPRSTDDAVYKAFVQSALDSGWPLATVANAVYSSDGAESRYTITQNETGAAIFTPLESGGNDDGEGVI